MAFKESLDVVLRDCKFLLNRNDLQSLLPGVESYLPPLTAIYYADKDAPRFVWGYPVIHGRRLTGALCEFITSQEQKYLDDPSYQENLRLLTPAQLKEEAYFKVLSHHLLETLAEGAFLKLDSILWIYLADLVCRRLNQDQVLGEVIERLHPNEHLKLNVTAIPMGRLRYNDPQRFADIRNRVLRSLFARNDFANSSMKEVFDEVPSNLLNREMIANRLVYTERAKPIYHSLEIEEAFLIKGYPLAPAMFSGINRVLRIVIVGMLERARTGNLLPLDRYFLTSYIDESVRDKALRLPSQGPGLQKKNLSPKELEEAEQRESLAYLLSLQEKPARYLLEHLPLHDRDYLKPIEKAVARLSLTSRESVKMMRQRSSAIKLAPQYVAAVRDILRWDMFQALKSRLRWVYKRGDTYYCDNRPLTRSTIPLNLDSFYEVYARSRHGTAVFIDLVGFTNRTKALTRELQEAAARGDKERYTLSSVSLAIQRVFSIRNHIEEFGGIPQGFEGDAILDTFPRAIDALRYVSAFADNYSKNRYIRFRPFERPSPNPYQEGFRVGLASGDYSLISIVGRSNDLQGAKSTDRAVGHTINRASRLNSGKKGDKIFLSTDDSEGGEETPDPLGLFKVHITPKQELHNDGIASYEDFYLELKRYVKAESMSWYEPRSGRGSTIGGVTPKFSYYKFEFIFEDPRLKKVCLIRRLPRSPILKGLEDEVITVFEYLLYEIDEFVNLVKEDAKLASTSADDSKKRSNVPSGPKKKPDPAPTDMPTGAENLPQSSFDWQDVVPDPEIFLAANPGLTIDDVLSGPEAVRESVEASLKKAEARAKKTRSESDSGSRGAERIDLSAVSVTSEVQEEVEGPAEPLFDDAPPLGASVDDDFRANLVRAAGALTPGEESRPAPITETTGRIRERLVVQEAEATRLFLDGSERSSQQVDEPPAAYHRNSDESQGIVAPALTFDDDDTSSERSVTVAEAVGTGADHAHQAQAGGSLFEEGSSKQEADMARADRESPETALPSGGPSLPSPASKDTDRLRSSPPVAAKPPAGQVLQGQSRRHPATAERPPMANAIVLAWRGPAETRPPSDPPIAPMPWQARGSDGEAADMLEARVSGYVFSAIMTSGKKPSRRVIIGKIRGEKLDDVHIYAAPPVQLAPWVLDGPLATFLKEKLADGGDVARKAQKVPPAILATMMPLPRLYLERLRKKRSRVTASALASPKVSS